MLGLRILPITQRVSPDLIEGFRGMPVANVSDCMGRLSAAGARLRPYSRETRLCASAITVKTRPGDNLMIHKALEIAQPGDVIVVDGGGDLSNALIGELMTTYAQQRGLAGFVIDGAVRDLDVIGAGRLPVFAAGVTHRGPYKDGPGEINVPIAIDGMLIHPGDLIIGDADGVLCVPREEAAALLEAAQKKSQAEQLTLQQIAEGRLDTAWIDQTLARLGFKG
jgi:RraA family protein